jgi:hypothetical protein
MSHGQNAPMPAISPQVSAAPGTDGRALAAVSVTVVAWASAFVAIRDAGRYFDPGALALGRLLADSLILGAVWLARGEGWPPRAAWPGIAGTGVLWFGVYMVALNWGERHVGGVLCLAGVAVSRGRRRQVPRRRPRARRNPRPWIAGVSRNSAQASQDQGERLLAGRAIVPSPLGAGGATALSAA